MLKKEGARKQISVQAEYACNYTSFGQELSIPSTHFTSHRKSSQYQVLQSQSLTAPRLSRQEEVTEEKGHWPKFTQLPT